MYDGLLMICFDATGKRYDLPPYVINEPLKYGAPKQNHKTVKPIKVEVLQLILRSTNFSDLSINVSSIDQVSCAKENFVNHHNLQGSKIRLFYCGKELKNELSFADYKIQNKAILQVFVTSIN